MWISLGRATRALNLIEQAEKSLGAEMALDQIKMAQSSLLFNLGAMNPNLMRVGLADMTKLLGSFRGKITDIVMKFKGGSLTREEALDQWQSLTGDYYSQIFQAGTKAAGNPFYAKMGMNDKDNAFIDSATQDELPYFDKFLDDVAQGKGVIDYEKRAGFYADTAKSQFFNGMVAGNGDNVGIKWVLDEFAEHCDDCVSLSAKMYTWKTLPFVPKSGNTMCVFNCKCFVDGRQGIMTDSGVKRISKIKEGDRVLTHTGKFEKVLKTWRENYEEEVVEVEIEVLGRRRKYKTTKDHQFMKPDGNWATVIDLKVGDDLFAIVQKCPQCAANFISNFYPYQCCSRSCSSKYFKKTKNANIKTRALAKEGKLPLLSHLKWRKGKTYEEIYGEERAQIEKNKRPGFMHLSKAWRCLPWEVKYGKEKAEKMKYNARQLRLGKTYEQLAVNVDPNEWRKNVVPLPYKKTSLELKTEEEISKLGIEFKPQVWIGRYRVDFLLPKQKIVVECDGKYWHSTSFQKTYDFKKDKFLEEQGFTVLRFTEKEICISPQLIVKRLGFTLLNHNGGFVGNVGVITKISTLKPVKGRLSYQLTVENSHSYAVWEGIVSKNCHLEFFTLLPSQAPVPPGYGTAQAIMAPGKNVLVFDLAGNPIVGSIQKVLDDLYAQLYKARQMITAVEDPTLRAEWIRIRREINASIIKAAGNYRAVPTVSVSRLTDIVKAAVQRGGVVTAMGEVGVGNEVLFIRGDYSAMGIVQIVRNRLTFVAPSGVKLPIDNETDVLFRFPAGGFHEQLEEGGPGSGEPEGHPFRGNQWTDGGSAPSGVEVGDVEKLQRVKDSLKQKEEHPAWDYVLKIKEQFKSLFKEPLISQEKAQELSNVICKELGINSAKVKFSNKVSKHFAADYVMSVVTIYSGGEVFDLVHELAHHVEHIIKGKMPWNRQYHGYGFNKLYRVTAEAFMRTRGIDVDMNMWMRNFRANKIKVEQLNECFTVDEQKEKLNREIVLKLLNNDQKLMDIWMAFYDQAIKDNSVIPVHLAWIKFRELYAENPVSGGWFELPLQTERNVV